VFEIGHSLREARVRHGLDLNRVEADTKIRAKYLQALEEENFELLPAETYVKGFLRTYANYLGLRNDKRVHPELVLIHFARNRNPDADEEGAAAAYKQFVEGLDMDSTSLIGHITFDK